ncbi:MAG: hypothetical protein LBR32_08345, partial [Propionibacteriaceae bacterium]|nr:hypothetical protein [Propionibacteriaceae bacterium]
GLDEYGQVVVMGSVGDPLPLPQAVVEDLRLVMSRGSAYPVYVWFEAQWEMQVQFVYTGSWDGPPVSMCEGYASGGFFSYRPFHGDLEADADTHWVPGGYSFKLTDCNMPLP